MTKKLTIAILGLGSRGRQVYAPILAQYPETMELVAVADIRKERVEEVKEQYHLREEQCFLSAETFFQTDRMADAVLICTQDRDHVAHALAAIKKRLSYPAGETHFSFEGSMQETPGRSTKTCSENLCLPCTSVCAILSENQGNAGGRESRKDPPDPGKGGCGLFTSGSFLCPGELGGCERNQSDDLIQMLS